MLIAAGGWIVAVSVGAWLLRLRSVLAWRMELVARASHELRGPITVARLGLEVLARDAGSAPEALRAIDLELAGVSAALDDLSAATAGGRGAWRVDAVDVPALLADSVAAFRPLADARGVELALDWRGGPGVLQGDRARLAQATGNLIANAIEHGEGRVALHGNGSAAGLEIAVTDGGPGLPAPVSELVARSRGGRRRRGHGLAIAADIAARHGGRLRAATDESGSRTTLELPVGRAGGGQAGTPPPAPGSWWRRVGRPGAPPPAPGSWWRRALAAGRVLEQRCRAWRRPPAM